MAISRTGLASNTDTLVPELFTENRLGHTNGSAIA
jgi:hypothetical protein